MTDADNAAPLPAEPPPGAEPEAQCALTALRVAGAEGFDPVRLHYLQALARRAASRQGQVKSLLDGKLAAALADFTARFSEAQSQARASIAAITSSSEDAAPTAEALQALYAAGDFKAIARHAASRQPHEAQRPLAELTRYLEQHTLEHAEVSAPSQPTAPATAGHASGWRRPRAELKSIRYFRNTWSKLSVDKQVALAIDQAPENAGPLNSHMLVLRSLALMRDTSPDYLNRFMSYVDTLLCLDHADKKNRPQPKKPAKAKAVRK